MTPPDRMFHVLVVGGIALVAPVGCGGKVETAQDAGRVDDGTDAAAEAFPSEAPPPSAFVDAALADAGTSSPDAATSADANALLDAGARDADGGFPNEVK